MEQWSYQMMIDLYLDGELPVEQRSMLFSALATNEELQQHFHQALLIRLAALQEAQHLMPSPALTARIMSAAQMPPPPTSFFARVWRSRITRSILAVGSAFVCGIAVGSFLAPTTTTLSPSRNAQFTTAQLSKDAAAITDVQTSETTASAIFRENPRFPVPMPTSSPSPSVHSSDNNPPESVAIVPVATRTSTVALVHTDTPTLPTFHGVPRIPSVSSMPLTIALPPVPWSQKESELIISMRRTSMLAFRQPHLLAPVSSSPVANTIVAVEFRERNVSLCAQAGYEQFPLLTAKEEGSMQGAATPIRQYFPQQQMWWIGAGLRAYLPVDTAESLPLPFRPFAGIMLGTSASGVLGRGEVGILWEVLPSVGIQFLLEGMVHSHTVGSQWEHAEKLSGSIGVAFRF
ncbi:MAG: hypothetical protein RML15_05190 [Bacteroidota bacterium]|nr:hypothetical protein [Candidatus Kapabacteria bacterium]MCS7302495.1 hypothetical protein [Candidatus Kapabacteria bacterium]MCX7937272.1 hypothetical protein [Chlorobiota bacterium]MDW8075535.1 hypothetical protein [Bacteroidota bacterium]MDW8271787.1 hypothetical protein [Bacteroidota bacterium]